MLTLELGPLALPVSPLLLLAAVWIAVLVARRLAGPGAAPAAEKAVWSAALVGLLAARGAHVLLHGRAYLASPWAVLDVRDGGFDDTAAVVAIALWLAGRCRRLPALRRPLVGGLLCGLLGWTAGSVAMIAAGAESARTPAPDVRLTELGSGRTARLPEVLAGTPAVVSLWASWCGPCRAEMPVLDAARRREGGIRFVLVNQGESAAVVQAWLQREGLPPDGVWLDTDQALGLATGSRGLPTTLFFDAQGRRIDAHLGVLNAAALQVRLQRLRPPP